MKHAAVWCALVLAGGACGGDDSQDTGDASETHGTSESSTTQGTSTSGTAATTAGSSETTTSTTAGSTTGTATTTDASESSGSGTGTTDGVDCSALPDGPIDAVLVSDVLVGADDIAFDGAGNLFAKQNDDIVSMTAGGPPMQFVALAGPAYDVRFDGAGNLLVARPALGVITEITPAGGTTDVATDLGIPNALHVDGQGRVWFTDPGESAIGRIEANGDVIPDVISGSGATGVGGVLFDEDRSLLFFTAYGFGQVRRAPIDGTGAAGTVEIVDMIGAAIHGLAMDACSHLYVVGHNTNTLYRIELDPQGDAVGEPVELATFDTAVYNARFGAGVGFSETSLYAAGATGSVWAVDVGAPAGI